MDRRQPDCAERDARVGDLAAVDPDRRRCGGDRPVAGAALDLLVRAAAARAQRNPNLGEQLAVGDRGDVRPDVEVLHPDDPLAVGAADHDLRLHGRADGRKVLRCIGLAERAADRAAVAHDGIGDHVLGVAKQRQVLGEQLGLQQIDVAGQRPDSDLVTPAPGCRRDPSGH